uniref:N(4)-(Beta-N-acetylglucosaminyl)-L-asparaginase- like isoform X2 n=1 Tax=Crassostrea virginica TaxID=6565 RepID=A0A8B8DXD7_CRAVI|nr:N(4)-(Beta-N-acetylglucosaminyl)-L-asparaginase-like isoform X2 [Crassostrea virginica]
MDLVIGTWSFCFDSIKTEEEVLKNHGSCLDVVEKIINSIEEDERYGLCVIGRGGPPNSAGYREYDAAVMEGRTLKFGAVTALRGIPTAVSVARAVMERSPHSMLSGEGAGIFARDQGFSITDSWTHQNPSIPQTGHDTLGLIAVSKDKNLAVDSYGAACCSGDGDQILKFCPAFHIVHLISQGKSPQEACEEVIQCIHRQSPGIEVAVIAADTKGLYGACSTVKAWTDPLTRSTTQDSHSYSGPKKLPARNSS